MTEPEPEPCVVGPDPHRCAYAGEDGKSACGEECLVAKGRREAKKAEPPHESALGLWF